MSWFSHEGINTGNSAGFFRLSCILKARQNSSVRRSGSKNQAENDPAETQENDHAAANIQNPHGQAQNKAQADPKQADNQDKNERLNEEIREKIKHKVDYSKSY
ncbi:MAG: hypothetical protein R3335_03905 [Anaerolineales bacterium]|nr:hypothetical protein [Anaerolineales bacterium]